MTNPESHRSTCPKCGAPRDPNDRGACPHCLMLAAMQPTEGTLEGGGMTVPSLAEVAGAFPQLEVIELLGQGGMGCVFKARQPRLNRLVALKLLPASLAQRDPAFAGRFEREGQLLARLHHPNIVAVHDSGTAGEFFFLIMEYVDGVNLRQAMSGRRFTAQQALAIVPHICDALQYAHDEGVLHRDIKPENILLDAKGRVKLADFGIAKLVAEVDLAGNASAPAGADLTHYSAALGTPSYMAPEQREKPQDVDHRADIYSLGVVFYELLTGELPRERFTPPSARSQADPRVDPIVRQALEKDRERRQRSAGEVRTQVTSLAQNATASPRQQPRYIGPVVLLLLAIMVPLYVMNRVDSSVQLRSAEHVARIRQEQQRVMSLSNQLGEANANAGRAASRAGNEALPDDFREEARKEQADFTERAGKVTMEMALAQAKLSDLMNARVDADRRGWWLILGSTLAFAGGALFLLIRNGQTRGALIGGGVLLAVIASFVTLRSIRISGAGASAQPAVNSSTPKYASIVSNNASALLAHDDLQLHYAVFYPGKFSTSNSGSQNQHGLTWIDDEAIKLANGRTFGLRRDSANDTYLTINGAEYDLRQGSLFVLSDDGTVAQRSMHPTLEEARSLEILSRISRGDSAATELEASAQKTVSAKKDESWSYTPRHFTQEKLTTWRNSPAAIKARWDPGISVTAKDGTITVTGPRERARKAATILRLLDQPEVKSPLELPLLNMDPASFTGWVLPDLLNRANFDKAPFTDALVESLSTAGISATQLALALSAHVLELEKATFVNQGVPFDTIAKSPGASTYYEATIPCADQPNRPLTLRIERTTQQMGTQSKIAELAPWLLEEAKAIVPEAR